MNLILTNEHLKSNINFFVSGFPVKCNVCQLLYIWHGIRSINFWVHPGLNICSTLVEAQHKLLFVIIYVQPKTLYKFCHFSLSRTCNNIVLIHSILATRVIKAQISMSLYFWAGDQVWYANQCVDIECCVTQKVKNRLLLN